MQCFPVFSHSLHHDVWSSVNVNACVSVGTNEWVNERVNCSDKKTGKERPNKYGMTWFSLDGIVLCIRGATRSNRLTLKFFESSAAKKGPKSATML